MSVVTKPAPSQTSPTAAPAALGMSILVKLTGFVAVLVTLTIGSLIGAVYLSARAMIRDQIHQRLAVVASSRCQMLLAVTRQLRQRVGWLAARPRLAELLQARAAGTASAASVRDEAGRILTEIRDRSGGYEAIWLTNPAGTIVAATDPRLVGRSEADDPDFRAGRKEPVLGEPQRQGAATRATLAAPMRDPAGRLVGVVRVALDLSPSLAFLVDPVGLEQTGEVLVGVLEGDSVRVLLDSKYDREGQRFPLRQWPGLSAAAQGREGFLLVPDPRGGAVLAAYRPVGYRQWGLTARLDEVEAYRPISRLRALLCGVGGGILALGLVASYFVARRFARPIRRLARATVAVAAGDLRAHVPIASRDEVTALAIAFDHMTDELADSRARLERQVAERTAILRSMLDCLGDAVIVADEQGRFLFFNPAAERFFGSGPTEAGPEGWSRQYGLYLPDKVTPFPPDQLPLARAMRGESVDNVEMWVRHPGMPEGSWTLISGRPLRDPQGVLRGGVIICRDIDERKRAEQRLAAQHATTRLLAESATLGEALPKILEAVGTHLDWDFGVLWRVDPRARVLRCGEVWHRPTPALEGFAAVVRAATFAPGVGLSGRVWASGEPSWCPDVALEPGLPHAAALDAADLHGAFGFPIRLEDQVLGVVAFYSHRARPLDPDLLAPMAGLGTQIGMLLERHQMHARIEQSERLASIGQLSAGIAHEINNPLAYVVNNLVLLERSLKGIRTLLDAYEAARLVLEEFRPELAAQIERVADDVDYAYIKESVGTVLASARGGAKRVAEIVENLRGFARLDRAAVDRVDLHQTIDAGLELIGARLGRREIAVERNYGDLPPVTCSPAQINQAFLNLLVNAMQAVEGVPRGQGRIEVHTWAADGEVFVEVADNGCGIAPEAIPRIFDPFFTTRPVGEGSGLGLSIAHGIIADHGGRIEVESRPGHGSRFRVVLPRAGKGGQA